jgi:hypothetical protein
MQGIFFVNVSMRFGSGAVVTASPQAGEGSIFWHFVGHEGVFWKKVILCLYGYWLIVGYKYDCIARHAFNAVCSTVPVGTKRLGRSLFC